MFRILQIDPENLSININAGAISRHPKAVMFFAFLDLISQYDLDETINIINDMYGEDLDLLNFVSNYIHELRHFGDLLVSPFGFYRIRTAFEFYINFPKVIFGSSDEIPIPLMSGMDPIVRSVIGASENFADSNLFRLGQTALSRRNVINKQNYFDNIRGEGYVGGDRILEGLAYITQFDYLFNKLDIKSGKSYFPDFYADFTGTKFDIAYRWFIPAVHALHPGERMPNNRLIYAILFASLCGHISIYSKPKHHNSAFLSLSERDIGQYLPSSRYFKLINHFLASPRPSVESDLEAYDLVNSAFKDLFGKSIFSEIQTDIDYTSEFIHDFKLALSELPGELSNLDASKCLEILNIYRAKMLEEMKIEPNLLFSSAYFARNATKFLKPSLIYNYPHGLDRNIAPQSAVRKKWIGLIDRTIEPPSDLKETLGSEVNIVYSLWSPMSGELGYGKGMNNINLTKNIQELDDNIISAFQTLYGIYSPIYRWILFGNKYQTMLEVENDNLPDALGIDPNRVVYDDLYQSTVDVSLPSSFHGFFRESSYKCDICAREISGTEGYIVSSRTIKQKHNLVEHFANLGSATYYNVIQKDWSDWMICKEDMEIWGIPIPKE